MLLLPVCEALIAVEEHLGSTRGWVSSIPFHVRQIRILHIRVLRQAEVCAVNNSDTHSNNKLHIFHPIGNQLSEKLLTSNMNELIKSLGLGEPFKGVAKHDPKITMVT